MTLYRLGNGLGKGLCPLAARRSLHSSATTSYSVINTPEIRAKTISDAAKWLRTEGKKYRITTADPSPVAASTAVVSGSESTDSAAVPEKSVKKQSKPRDASKATLSMEGPVFVAGDRPFPMNPDFRPVPPLNDRIRSMIYESYMASPLDNSPRKLAVEHGLSISRVEMILKLKALEKQIEAKKGFLGERMGVQDLFMESMERLLGVKRFKTISEYRKTERLRNSESLRLKPVFATIEEHETLTPEDAALLLQVDPYSKIQGRLDKTSERVSFLGNDSSEKEAAILSTDRHAGGRHAFIIRDTSQGITKPKLTVRTKDGILRRLTKRERILGLKI